MTFFCLKLFYKTAPQLSCATAAVIGLWDGRNQDLSISLARNANDFQLPASPWNKTKTKNVLGIGFSL